MRRRTLLQGLASSAGLSLAGSEAWAQNAKPGRWLRLESTNFVVVSAADEEKTRAELGALEGFHKLLSMLMPRKEYSPQKLQVHMTGADRDFKATAPWAESGVLGFYETSAEQVRAVSTTNKNIERQRDMAKNVRALDSRAVLFHEYAHHYVMANTRLTYPAWYNEGIAEFLSTADFVDDGVHLGKFTANRATWLANSSWLGIETFLTKNPRDLGRDRQAEFYAQAWLAAHYLFTKAERARGFDKYVDALQAGGDPMQAFEPAFGVTPAAFDGELRAYRHGSIQFLKLGGFVADPLTTVVGERLPSSADEMFMPMAHIRAAPKPGQARRSVEVIRQQAGKYPGDAFATRALALAEIWYGDLTVARKLLDGLLVTDAGNAETQHLRGLCNLRLAYATGDASLFPKARTGFTTAHKIDATRACSLFRYVECLFRETSTFDQHAMDVLAIAYKLSPQVDEYVQATAYGLMHHKRFAEAIAILRPAVADSHDSDTTKAQALMAAAKAEKLPVNFGFPGSADSTEKDDI